MARGDRKKGRENKKPKQTDAKSAPKSAYAVRQGETTTTPFKIRTK